MKLCKGCSKTKSANEFSKHVRNKDGLQTQCKKCRIEYYQANRIRRLEYQANYAAENPEVGRKAAERWRNRHPKLYKARIEDWREKNPDKLRAHRETRRALQRECEATLTHQEWAEILEVFQGAYFWCGGTWEEQDHLIPLSKGGSHSKHNVVPSCRSCNRKKATKDPLVFLFSILEE